MRNLLTAIAMVILATTPAMAQGLELDSTKVENVKKSSPYKTFMQVIDEGKCTTEGICADEDAAMSANIELKSARMVIKKTFPRQREEAWKNILGAWDRRYKANPETVVIATADPCNPSPCKKGQSCKDVDGQAVCEDAVVVAVADPVKPKVKRPKVKKPKVKKPKVKKPKVKPPVAPPTEVVEVFDSSLCCLDCGPAAEEYRTPWAVILLSQLLLVILASLLLWWFFLRKKGGDEKPPAPPPSGIEADDMEKIMEMVDGEIPNLFLQLLDRLVSLLIKHPDSNKEVTSALEQGMRDLRKSLATVESSSDKDEESLDESSE